MQINVIKLPGNTLAPADDASHDFVAKQADMSRFTVEINIVEDPRTLPQNRSLHLYCTLLGKALNSGGYTVKVVLVGKLENKVMSIINSKAPDISDEIQACFDEFITAFPIDWSTHSVKDIVWRPIQVSLTGKESTKDLTTTEVNTVYSMIDRAFSERYGVQVNWPSYR